MTKRFDDVGFGFIVLGGLLLILGIFLEGTNVLIVGQIFYYVGLLIAVLGIALLIYEALKINERHSSRQKFHTITSWFT